MQQRKRYSEEFKREAVGLTRLPGANVSQIARDLGIRASQIHRWRRDLETGGEKAFPGNGVARDQELLAHYLVFSAAGAILSVSLRSKGLCGRRPAHLSDDSLPRAGR